VCAFQYNAINRAILDARNSIPERQWTEVFYEDLVRDPVSGFENVFRHCDLRFDAQLRAHTQDVLNTPYNAFSEIRLDKWKSSRNCEKINRVLPAVRDTGISMGYEA
jgi:hypothetical protein